MTLVSTFGNAKVRFLSEKKEFYSRKVSLMTKIGNRNRLLCGFTFKTSYNSSQKYWDVSSISHIRMYWKVSRKAMTSRCSLSLSVLPIQNMAMLPSRKWKVSAWMSDITFPRYRYCRTRASSLAQSGTFPTRDCSRFCLTYMTGKKFKPFISRRLLAYGC